MVCEDRVGSIFVFVWSVGASSTRTTTSARFVTSYVLLAVSVCEPLTSSEAVTVTAVPFIVPPFMYPVVLVTFGVTVTEWFVTVPFVAVGVPADPDVTAYTVTELR